jgi:hypothetical protein
MTCLTKILYTTLKQTNKYVVIDFDYAIFENDNTLDVFNANWCMIYCLYYPNKIENEFGQPFMLPDTSISNKYANYVVVQTLSQPLDHYINILSVLLGEKELRLTLEHGQKEKWQYGVRKR